MSAVQRGNIFAPPETTDEGREFFEVLAQKGGIRVERIVSMGQSSPAGFWYDQEEDEWVLLVQGTAELEYEDGRILPLSAGDWTWIPAHERHRVSHTSDSPPCVWLAVFF